MRKGRSEIGAVNQHSFLTATQDVFYDVCDRMLAQQIFGFVQPFVSRRLRHLVEIHSKRTSVIYCTEIYERGQRKRNPRTPDWPPDPTLNVSRSKILDNRGREQTS